MITRTWKQKRKKNAGGGKEMGRGLKDGGKENLKGSSSREKDKKDNGSYLSYNYNHLNLAYHHAKKTFTAAIILSVLLFPLLKAPAAT